MSWYMACYVDDNGVLREIGALGVSESLPLYIHFKKSRGLKLATVADLKMVGVENFRFEGDIYRAVTMVNLTSDGRVIFISDIPIKAMIYETVLNQLNIGLQIFDSQTRLVFLNDTCRRIESLIRQNVIGKRLKEIYTVDAEYSTILTTLSQRRPINDRCDIFSNRFGDQLSSINSGFPLFLDGRLVGAYGLVMDMECLSAYEEKREKLRHFLNSAGKSLEKSYDIIDRYYIFSDIVFVSKAMQDAVNVAKKVATSDFSVMLLGETGTGKEMFAQSIHSSSLRKNGNFVAINCSAIPSTIIESTLFGTVKGAFTGSGNQKGLLDEADGGTLFLDEINSMDYQVQSKLLRVVQEKKFRRVGGLKDIACNFRIIAAMNEPSSEAIKNGRLRQDLYYRLNTVSIEIPPLRERPEDIPILVESHLRGPGHSARPGRKLAPQALEVFMKYDWPGNVRELFHSLDYATAVADGDILEKNHLPARLTRQKPETSPLRKRQNYLHQGLRNMLFEHEKHLVETAMKRNNNNVTQTARELKLSRQALQNRLKKLRLNSHQK